jgi:hypothetical protein
MNLENVNPIKKFEGLSRNQKLMVFAGAAALGGYLYYRSKQKGEESEGESESEYEPNGVSGEHHAEPVGTDEGIGSEGGTDGGGLEGGFGGSAIGGLSQSPNVTNADGTVPSVPSIGTVNGDVNAGGGTINQGTGAEHAEAAPDVSQVTGGGAPVTPHAAHAHLPAKKSTMKKSPAKHHGTQKRKATHTKRKKTVGQKPTTHKTAHKAPKDRAKARR